MKDFKKMEDEIRQGIHKEYPVDEALWASAEEQLDVVFPLKKNKVYGRVLVLLLFLGAITTLWFFSKPQEELATIPNLEKEWLQSNEANEGNITPDVSTLPKTPATKNSAQTSSDESNSTNQNSNKSSNSLSSNSKPSENNKKSTPTQKPNNSNSNQKKLEEFRDRFLGYRSKQKRAAQADGKETGSPDRYSRLGYPGEDRRPVPIGEKILRRRMPILNLHLEPLLSSLQISTSKEMPKEFIHNLTHPKKIRWIANAEISQLLMNEPITNGKSEGKTTVDMSINSWQQAQVGLGMKYQNWMISTGVGLAMLQGEVSTTTAPTYKTDTLSSKFVVLNQNYDAGNRKVVLLQRVYDTRTVIDSLQTQKDEKAGHTIRYVSVPVNLRYQKTKNRWIYGGQIGVNVMFSPKVSHGISETFKTVLDDQYKGITANVIQPNVGVVLGYRMNANLHVESTALYTQTNQTILVGDNRKVTGLKLGLGIGYWF